MINRAARGLNSDHSLLLLTLGLTAALGVTSSLMSAVLYGLFFLVLMTFCVTVASSLHEVLGARLILGLTVLLAALLVTLADFLLGLYLPALKKLWGLYLPLTVVSPLLLIWGFETSQAKPVPETFRLSLQTGGRFLLLLAGLGLLRELLGTGGLNLAPVSADLHLPWLTSLAPSVFVTAAGGFILLGLITALARAISLKVPAEAAKPAKPVKPPKPAKPAPAPRPEPKPQPVPPPRDAHPEPAREVPPAPVAAPPPPAEPEPQAPEAHPAPVSAEPPTAQPAPAFTLLNRHDPLDPGPAVVPESTETSHPETDLEGEQSEPAWQPVKPEWGETLDEVLAALGRNKDFERKRILVLGCGTGEEAYFYAMKLLEARKANSRLTFKVRGIDAFPARIATALEGIYPEVQVDFIPLDLKKDWMLKSREEEKRLARMNNEIRTWLEFEVADYLSEEIYFTKPADLITLNQPVDYLSEEKCAQLLRQIRTHLTRDGALWLKHPLPREAFPDGLKRTGEKIWRRRY